MTLTHDCLVLLATFRGSKVCSTTRSHSDMESWLTAKLERRQARHNGQAYWRQLAHHWSPLDDASRCYRRSQPGQCDSNLAGLPRFLPRAVNRSSLPPALCCVLMRVLPEMANDYSRIFSVLLQFFSEGNGGESRKSYHGYPAGTAQLIDSPTEFVMTPMQVRTVRRVLWHRVAFIAHAITAIDRHVESKYFVRRSVCPGSRINCISGPNDWP